MATVNSIAIDLITADGEATDDSGFVSMVEARINDALDEIAVATNWDTFRARSTFNTVVAQAAYQLPVGGRELIQLQYTDNGTPIKNWSIQEAARRGAKLTTAGRARNWFPDGRLVSGANVLLQFRLYPVPDAIVEVEQHYYYHPSEIASASVLPVQDEYLVLVRDRGRAYLLERQGKYDAADRAQRRYEGNLDKLIKRQQGQVAVKAVLKPSDLNGLNKPARPILDPDHYQNNW